MQAKFVFLKPQLLLAFIFALTACEAQVQKENFRKVSTESPTPSASSSDSSGSASANPSSSSSPQESAIPDSSLSATITPISIPSPHTSQSASASASPSASPSSSSATVTGDSQAPTPGNGGQIDISNITSSALDLGWSTASDNKTAATQLQYVVYVSTSNNLTSVAAIEANGTTLDSYFPDLSGKTISALNSATTYYFNVIVKDSAGNKAAYNSASATTVDVTPPVPGASGVITASNFAATSLNLAWAAATDTVTASTQLQYLVYRSTVSSFSTVADVENNGIAVGTYTANITTKAVTGLISSRTYFFNIIVKDAAGNKAIYTTQTGSTLDITAPSPGSLGVMSLSSATPTGLTLDWTKATDNFSAQSDLQYLVYQSSSNNIPSISGAETNGTALGSFANDIGLKVITGLTPDTTYYFNVIARDAAGNKVSYTMFAGSSLPLPPSLASRTQVYAKISSSFNYNITTKYGSLPLSYSLTSAPAGATVNQTTGAISYSTGASIGTQNFTVLVTDAIGRTDTKNLVLNIGTIDTCVWTGATNTDFKVAGNWIFCQGAVPSLSTSVIIDVSATNQPVLSTSILIAGFGAATMDAGGTLTVGPGAQLEFLDEGILSDLKIQGATPTCSTCKVRQYWDNVASISNGATLTLGSGITLDVGGNFVVGSVTNGTGRLITAVNGAPANEWPVIETHSRLTVIGASGSPGSISIDGLKIKALSGSTSFINFSSFATIDKLRNVHFLMATPNGYGGSTATVGVSDIYFPNACSNITINDANWSNLYFAEGTRAAYGNVSTTTVNMGNCATLTPITISGSGRAYGFEVDPNNLLTWANNSSATCTWTGAVDTDWATPGNWSNCTNGRNNYPDQLDWVVIPVTANQPAVTGNQATQGTAAGTGGGTITVNANSTLYLSSMGGDTLSSSVKFAGGSAGCTTCLVQPRYEIAIGDGVSLTLLPNIKIGFSADGRIVVGESSGRSNRAASLIVNGGATAANYPVLDIDPNLLYPTESWEGILVDGSTAQNSVLTIDGLKILNTIYQSFTRSGNGINFMDRYTVTKLDHLTIATAIAPAWATSYSLFFTSCTNASIVTTWNDLTLTNAPTPGYAINISAASCSGVSPITINGQGDGYGSSFSSDPNNVLIWQ